MDSPIGGVMWCAACKASVAGVTDALSPCPTCGGALSRQAGDATREDGPDIANVARRQRQLLWTLLASLLAFGFDLAGADLLFSKMSPEFGDLIWLVLYLGVALASVVVAFMLMAALRIGLLWRVLCIPLLLMGLFQLILLLLINRRATRVLRSLGVKVGLMGADLEAVRIALNPSLCRACGYNLTGNTSNVCPECGTAVPIAARHVMKITEAPPAFRLGHILAMRRNAELPPRCVRCGADANVSLYPHNFRRLNPWWYLLLIQPWFFLVAAAIARTQAKSRVPLCKTHRERRTTQTTVGIVLLVAGLTLMLASTVLPYVRFLPLAIVTLLFGALIVLVTVRQPAQPLLIDESHLYLLNASPVLLNLLPSPPPGWVAPIEVSRVWGGAAVGALPPTSGVPREADRFASL